MTTLFQVIGIYDAFDGQESVINIKPLVATFATEAEAKEACELVNQFYFEKCKMPCAFEVRKVKLQTIESLKASLDKEYVECWAPTL